MAVEKDYLNLTLGDRLVNVRRAIDKAELSQSYKVNNRETERAKLETLYLREKELLAKISKHGADYVEGAKKSTRTTFKMVGTNVSF
ncbi:MAG TPA: hypothetical protein EYG94_00040 [Campylobacterales bacterium]|nr:hypothetical protein [Sulfurospirillum arcachonense]HIP50448.1 hypothetical protein [Campylobacterales bacterium]